MKKLLTLALALCLLFSLAACGGSGGSDTSSASSGTAATDTVAVGAVIIARDDVNEDDIYSFVSTIFENVAEIAEQHGKGAELDLGFASGVTSVPYHPGAAKYFAEKGHEVASVKDGAGTGASAALTFGTGGDTGTYYGFGSVLANYVTNANSFSVTAVTSGGSKSNIEDMAANDVQLGFVQSDVMSYAYNGERLFDEAITGFSVVAALYMEQVQIVTTNASISSVSDLAGKTVSIGAVGSGVYFNAIDVLDAYGLSESDIKRQRRQPEGRQDRRRLHRGRRPHHRHHRPGRLRQCLSGQHRHGSRRHADRRQPLLQSLYHPRGYLLISPVVFVRPES